VAGDGRVSVFDARKRALMHYDAQGEYLEQVRFEIPGFPSGLALFGGEIVYSSQDPRRDDDRRGTTLWIAAEGDTVAVASLITSPVKNQLFESCGVGLSLAPIFENRLLWRVAGRAVVVNREPLYVIDLHTREGLQASVRREAVLRPATQELAAQEVGEGLSIGIGSASNRCLIPPEEVVEKRGVAETVPAIRDVMVEADGTLWVQRWRVQGEEPVTDLFDTMGEYQGTLRGPHPFPVAFLPGGDVLAVEKDEFDLQRLVVYRVARDDGVAR
jgi:hypothetical protein